MYFGPVEIRNWQVPGQEQVLTYPLPSVRLTNGVPSYLRRDHLGSIRAITNATGAKIESAVYKPFGEQTETLSPANLTPESKGWIGQRYDADAGLQYLNARYYDPVLGLFLQPDWFEVLRPGVGTNRFSYSFNDPVNMSDPTGNEVYRRGAFSASEQVKLQRDFQAGRDVVTRARDSADAIIALGTGNSRKPTGESRALIERLSRANGGQGVTVDDVRRFRRDAQRTLDRVGELGAGIVVTREAIHPTAGANARASAVRNSNSMTIYDSYFDPGNNSSSRSGYQLFHELGHAILGNSDRLPLAAYGLAPSSARDRDVFLALDKDGNPIGTDAYRWAGIDLAGREYPSVTLNDEFTCSAGFTQC